ncbi:hypothetical protein WA026_023051, partial [Henosepilachna vigintioctopunctata]
MEPINQYLNTTSIKQINLKKIKVIVGIPLCKQIESALSPSLREEIEDILAQ